MLDQQNFKWSKRRSFWAIHWVNYRFWRSFKCHIHLHLHLMLKGPISSAGQLSHCSPANQEKKLAGEIRECLSPYLRWTESRLYAVEQLLEDPTPDPEDGSDPVEFDPLSPVAHDERDVEDVRGRRQPQHRHLRREVEGLGKVLGHLVLAFEQIAHGVQEGAGGTHVANGAPRAAPWKQKGKNVSFNLKCRN